MIISGCNSQSPRRHTSGCSHEGFLRGLTDVGDLSWSWVALSQGFGNADADKVDKEETDWVPALISVCFLAVNSVWPATCGSSCHTYTFSCQRDSFLKAWTKSHTSLLKLLLLRNSQEQREKFPPQNPKQMKTKTSKWQHSIEYTPIWLGAQRKHLAWAKVEARWTKALSWITILPQTLNPS